jgi:putative ABC transport system permease protein
MRTLLQDLRYGFRNLLASRGFAVIAVLTLAAGIGANTAIFSIVDAILIRPLPYPNPDRLVRLYETESAPGTYPFTGPDFIDWKAQNSTFTDMALYGWASTMNLAGKGQAEHVIVSPTEANYFALLGAKPLLGRTFAQGEDQPGKNDLAILSYGEWQKRFGGDPKAVGQTVELNAKKYTVIGVMPYGFAMPFRTDYWTPLDVSGKGLGERGSHWANAIGRLKAGVTIKKAEADVKVIAARLEKAYPDSNHKVGAVVVSLQEDLIGRSRNQVMMMLAAVGLVLLIACANIANLMLSRAVSRQKEMAVRSALGASRSRLLQQLLTESVLLALAGGCTGLLLGWGLLRLLPKIKSFSLPDINVVQLNGSVLVFTFGLAVVTGILFGLAPALQISRPDVHEELKGGAGSALSPRRRQRLLRNLLVIGEIALSMLLLISAGLLLKDFWRVRSVEVGVRREGVWSGAIELPESKYDTVVQRSAFCRKLLEEARALPGVQTAALTDRMPLEGGSNYYVQVRGRVSETFSGPLVETHRVTAEYFRTLGVPLIKGRVFTDGDIEQAMSLDTRRREAFQKGVRFTPEQTNAMVYPTVINQTMARYFWPNEDPIGKMFAGGGGGQNGPWREVIGVVGDVRQWGLTQKPQPEAHDPLYSPRRVFLALHTSVPPLSLTAPVRRALAKIDSSLALYRARTIEDVVDDNSRGARFLSALVGTFAGLAALLAAMGVYGVLSYAVTQRTREIGIRMSLGASRSRVVGEVLRDGMLLALVGFAVGIGGAFAASHLMESLLHGLDPRDPGIWLGTAALLTVVTLLACIVPARRAAHLDPMRALRYD